MCVKGMILLEINVSSVAHAMRGLQKKHWSPIESLHSVLTDQSPMEIVSICEVAGYLSRCDFFIWEQLLVDPWLGVVLFLYSWQWERHQKFGVNWKLQISRVLTIFKVQNSSLDIYGRREEIIFLQLGNYAGCVWPMLRNCIITSQQIRYFSLHLFATNFCRMLTKCLST
jgi:hypothetical protein